jgi:benzoate membrane transport protein
MLALGLTGLVRRVMSLVPMPIVMGMVAGVFLQFGLDWIRAIERDFAIAAAMTAIFLVASAMPSVAARCPPLILALVTGVAVAVLQGRLGASIGDGALVADPKIFVPELSWQAALELVVPLAITVLVVQNGQGNAILTAAGHDPPVNAIAAGCGVGAFVSGLLGSASTCLTGPVNALITSTGDTRGHYTAAVLVGLIALLFGVFAPLLARFMLAAPPAFIATLAGLGLLRVLQGAFTIAFKDRFPLGALVTFLVTVSGISILNVGAPFWGLVLGVATSWVLERAQFERRNT